MGRWILAIGCATSVLLADGRSAAAPAESNSVTRGPVSIGPESARLIVGFRAETSRAVQAATVKRGTRSYRLVRAQTDAEDARALAQRSGLALGATRQITSDMHVLLLRGRLYGAALIEALARLRADPRVAFAAVDGRRHALASVTPNDPLFGPTPGTASGQWYLGAPNSNAVAEGVPTTDLSATDAVDAWGLTKGSTGVVIADVDTGVRFDHPDLLRAGQGGRLLPGFDFVGQDYDPNTSAALGTFLIANDGDGWDPDPSDPGDWIDSTDIANPNNLFANQTAAPSSWHGTRVVGVYGALTDNGTGVAGNTWNSWILPVRALGKGGGYDSDIIAGIEWAAGMTVTNPDGSAVPSNPYPADIVNLSIGGSTDACTLSDQNGGAAYAAALPQVTALGVLIVIAAGNENGPVNLPGNCAGSIAGVMAVAGLRNVGTKVGYSSFGPEVSVGAPAGNCLTTLSGAPCLRSIDTTTNLGATVPGANSYTDEMNPNLGTSFATPIVAGIAGLMRAVNNNLTPAQLADRIEASATPFPPNTAGLAVCPNTDPTSAECACPAAGQCGAGMVNAYQAVLAAQRPIAAVAVAGNPLRLDAGGSAASCGRSIKSYAWTASGGATIVSGSSGPQATWAGAGTVTLTVTDELGATDSAIIAVSSIGASSSAPGNAGTAATACPTPIDAKPVPPTVTQGFSPATVRPSTAAMLTITFTNTNGFALTQTNFGQSLPTGLTIASSPAAQTTCTGASVSVSDTASTISLKNAIVPANGACSVSVSVSSSANGTYTNDIAANALMTAPAGGNVAASSAALTVSTPASSGGGGSLDWLDLGLCAALLGLLRRRVERPTGSCR